MKSASLDKDRKRGRKPEAPRRCRGKLYVVVTMALLLPDAALSADIEFTGAQSSDWNNSSNWKPAQIPNTSSNIYIGDLPGSVATATVATGNAFAGSLNLGPQLELPSWSSLTIQGGWTLSIAGTIRIGAATLTIENGSIVLPLNGSCASQCAAFVDRGGIADVTGASAFWKAYDLYVGNLGAGSLTVEHGATQQIFHSATLGQQSASTGTVTVTGAGSSWNGKTASLTVGGFGKGILNIKDHGQVSSGESALGLQGGSEGTANLDAGAQWMVTGPLTVGGFGNGTLTALGGSGVGTTSELIIGEQSGSVGAATFQNSSFTTTDLLVGNSGDGVLDLLDESKARATTAIIGNDPSGVGHVQVTGKSSLSVTGDLWAGLNGNGTLAISGGGTVSNADAYVGYNNTGIGAVTVTGDGSVWNTTNLQIGFLGRGAVTLSDQGTVNVGGEAGNVMLATRSGSSGELAIGAASGDPAATPGVLNAKQVSFGQGDGSLIFNHTGTNYTFSPTIVGHGAIDVLAGFTTLSADNSGFTGTTNASGGILSVTGILGGTVDVLHGGKLQGSGFVGATTIENGGTLASFEKGHLTVQNSLTLNSGANFNYTPSSGTGAAVVVNGDLTMNGAALNIEGPQPALGYYRLFSYSGTLVQSSGGLVIGEVPPGSAFPDNYYIDTSLSNVVDLVVSPDGTNLLQLWGGGKDGTGYGNGTWNSENKNWLDLGGTGPGIWGSSYGVFRDPNGVGGIVQVEGEQKFAGLQFVSGDYQISSTGSGSQLRPIDWDNRGDDGTAEVRVLDGVTAEIGAAIVGDGGIDKTGGGTLLLSGANTYHGGTFIEGGTLQIGQDRALGTGGLAFSNGGVLHTTADMMMDRIITLNGAGAFNVDSGTTLASTGPVSGAGQLSKLGDGALTLQGPGTWTGGTLIEAGLMRADAAGALPNGTDYTLTGGTLDLNGHDLTMRNLWGSGGTIELGGAQLTANSDDDSFYAGRITGTGSLVKSGDGWLGLSGSNTYTGGTTINGGALAIFSDANLGAASGSVNLNAGGMLASFADISTGRAVNISELGILAPYDSTLSVSGDISGSGTLLKLGNGTLILTGANTQTGTYIGDGILQIGDGGLNGSITGDIFNETGLAFNRAGTLTYDGQIFGSGQVVQNGPGTTILTADSTYSGGTVINSGILQLGNGGASGWIAGNVSNNGTLGFDRSDAIAFGGIISGTGSVRQMGSGTIVLSAVNSYSGATDVDSGRLSVNGSIAASSLTTVHAGGILGGNGIVGTTFVDGGVLAPGNSIGLLTVDGDLSFTSAATYMVEVSPTNADRTNVTGAATLNGATVAALYAPGSYVVKRYTILNATGGITGQFEGPVNTNLPQNFDATLSYDQNNAYLDLALHYRWLNINQQNVSNALDGYFNRTGGIPLAFGALTPYGLTVASGELPTRVQQATYDAMGLFMGTMTDPFIAGRREAFDRTTFTSRSTAYAAENPQKRPLAPASNEPWSVWAAGYGGSRSTDGNPVLGSNNTSSQIYGVVVGADYRLSSDTRVGFALAGGGTGFSVTYGGTGRSDLFQAGAFVRHDTGPNYLSAALAYGWQDIKTDRYPALAGQDHLQARFNANAFSGRLEGGHRFAMNSVGFTPYVAAQATALYLPTYAESTLSGQNTFALTYDSKQALAARSEFGLHIDKSFAMADGIFSLRWRGAWAHDFNPERTIGATFQTLPGASFVVNGATQASDTALVSSVAEVRWLNGWSASLSFEGEFSPVAESYAGKGGFRFQW